MLSHTHFDKKSWRTVLENFTDTASLLAGRIGISHEKSDEHASLMPTFLSDSVRAPYQNFADKLIERSVAEVLYTKQWFPP